MWRLNSLERDLKEERKARHEAATKLDERKADVETVNRLEEKVDSLTRALWAFALGVPIGGIGLFLTALVIIQAAQK